MPASRPAQRGSISGRGLDCQTDSETHTTPNFLWRRSGRGVKLTPPSNVRDNNVWSYTSTPPRLLLCHVHRTRGHDRFAASLPFAKPHHRHTSPPFGYGYVTLGWPPVTSSSAVFLHDVVAEHRSHMKPRRKLTRSFVTHVFKRGNSAVREKIASNRLHHGVGLKL